MFHFAEEEINDSHLIADLAARESDAPIFITLGFTYGKAVWFTKEFQIQRARAIFPGCACLQANYGRYVIYIARDKTTLFVQVSCAIIWLFLF